MKDYWAGLPPHLRIGAHDINIIVIPDVGADSDGNTLAGAFCEANQNLTLVEGTPSKTGANETLIHEICHAILAPLSLEDEIDERACTALGAGLVQVFRDNPTLVKWLFNKDNKKRTNARRTKKPVKPRKARRAS